MLVLHAWWRAPSAADDGALVVWAEDSAAPVLAPRGGRVPRGAAHPFAADAAQLSAALGLPFDLPFDLGDRRRGPPSRGGRPWVAPRCGSSFRPPFRPGGRARAPPADAGGAPGGAAGAAPRGGAGGGAGAPRRLVGTCPRALPRRCARGAA